METLPPLPLRFWLLTLVCAAAFGLLWWTTLGLPRWQRRRGLQQRLYALGDGGADPVAPIPPLLSARAADARRPWLLFVGDTAADVPGLLAASGAQPTPAGGLDALWQAWTQPALTAIALNPAVLRDAADARVRRQWLRGLLALAAQRPALPLDGIVFCIDAAALSQRPPQLPANVASLVREASQLLRLQLPVYLLVTGLERLPGHAEVCAGLAPAVLAQALGHRVPRDDEAGSAGERLDALFAPLAQRLQALCMALQRAQPDPLARLAIDGWAQQLVALQPGLRALVTSLFEPVGGARWRGIYLCASATRAAPEGAFVADLFQRFLPGDRALARTRRGAG